MEGEPDPVAEGRAPIRGARSSNDGSGAVGTDDDGGRQAGSTSAVWVREVDVGRVAPAGRQPHAANGNAAPDLRAAPARVVEQRRIERGPVEPDRRRRERAVVAVGQPEPGAADRLDAHRRDRTRHRIERRLR